MNVIYMDGPADCGGESVNKESVDVWDPSSVAPLGVSSMFSPEKQVVFFFNSVAVILL